MNVTTKRRLNGSYDILLNGEKVGEAWRYPKAECGNAFGMRLEGYCWWKGEARPRERGGFSTVDVPRLRDAVALARATLANGVPGAFICRKPAIGPACEKQCERCAAYTAGEWES